MEHTPADPAAVLHLIRRLNFPRFAGSEGESRAQAMVVAELAEVGVDAVPQPFDAPWVEIAEASIEANGENRPLLPIEELMQQTAVWGPPPSLDAEGVLRPVEDLGAAPTDASIIAVHREPHPIAAALKGPAAQLFLFDETPEVHPYAVSVHPSAPPAYVLQGDRDWVASHLKATARVRWQTTVNTRTFANLRADLPGETDESIVVGAHLDSFPGTPGSSDNAFGSALLVELARRYAKRPRQRTLRFWWFTGEEIDRRGSRAAAEFELAQEPRAALMINVDSGVTAEHGEPSYVRVSGGDRMIAWAREAVAGLASPPEVIERCTEAADVQPFWEAGFPTAFPHSTRTASGPYPHLPTDDPDSIDPGRVARLSAIAVALVETAVAAPPRAVT
jgi:aminopeptidase YwaD